MEIKFRAWHKGKMYYSCKDYTIWAGGKNASITGNDFKTILTEDVMQYTGLKDKNGKDIYEGDIVRYEIMGKEGTEEQGELISHGFNKVIWDDINLWFCIYDDDFHLGAYIGEDLEIIGNIHDNPELSEDK